MTISRVLFSVNTDTGTQTQTSSAITGRLVQTRWYPSTADTGGDLRLIQAPNPTDTGEDYQFAADHDILGTPFTKVYTQDVHDTGGEITGVRQHVVFAGEQLRVLVVPGGAAVVGTVKVWMEDN